MKFAIVIIATMATIVATLVNQTTSDEVKYLLAPRIEFSGAKK